MAASGADLHTAITANAFFVIINRHFLFAVRFADCLGRTDLFALVAKGAFSFNRHRPVDKQIPESFGSDRPPHHIGQDRTLGRFKTGCHHLLDFLSHKPDVIFRPDTEIPLKSFLYGNGFFNLQDLPPLQPPDQRQPHHDR